MIRTPLETRFTHHSPTDEQILQYADIRAQALEFAKYIDATCPFGQELALALAALEECVMWAEAAIARNK